MLRKGFRPGRGSHGDQTSHRSSPCTLTVLLGLAARSPAIPNVTRTVHATDPAPRCRTWRSRSSETASAPASRGSDSDSRFEIGAPAIMPATYVLRFTRSRLCADGRAVPHRGRPAAPRSASFRVEGQVVIRGQTQQARRHRRRLHRHHHRRTPSPRRSIRSSSRSSSRPIGPGARSSRSTSLASATRRRNCISDGSMSACRAITR